MKLRNRTLRYLQRRTLGTQKDPGAHARSLPDAALVKFLSKASLDDPSTLFYLLELRRRSAHPGRRRRAAEEFDWTEIINCLFPGSLRTIQRKLKACRKKVTPRRVPLNPAQGVVISPMLIASAHNLAMPHRPGEQDAVANRIGRTLAVNLNRFGSTMKNIRIAEKSRGRLIGPLPPGHFVEAFQSELLPVDLSELFAASTRRSTTSQRLKV